MHTFKVVPNNVDPAKFAVEIFIDCPHKENDSCLNCSSSAITEAFKSGMKFGYNRGILGQDLPVIIKDSGPLPAPNKRKPFWSYFFTSWFEER